MFRMELYREIKTKQAFCKFLRCSILLLSLTFINAMQAQENGLHIEAGFGINTAYESKFMKSTVISSGATGLTIEVVGGQNNQYSIMIDRFDTGEMKFINPGAGAAETTETSSESTALTAEETTLGSMQATFLNSFFTYRLGFAKLLLGFDRSEYIGKDKDGNANIDIASSNMAMGLDITYDVGGGSAGFA